jgi:hypothetical protein
MLGPHYLQLGANYLQRDHNQMDWPELIATILKVKKTRVFGTRHVGKFFTLNRQSLKVKVIIHIYFVKYLPYKSI